MKHNKNILKGLLVNALLVTACVLILAGCKKDNDSDKPAEVIRIMATGDITAKVNEFREVLGSQLNTTPGVVGGRREINWDGVPADLLEKPLPGNFFNTIGSNVPASRQRGLVYAAAEDNFQVSNNGFQSVNSSNALSFTAFSGNQVFANVSSKLWDISFQIPGEPTPASVNGFGIVFADVDVANSTFVEFFNGSQSLGKFFAPVHDATSKLSFVGVYFNNEKITQVRVGHDATLAEGGTDISQGGQKDFVVFDDFLFSEPVK